MGKQMDRKEREARKLMREGSEAFHSGARPDQCPHHSRVEWRELWLRGYQDAERNHRVGPVDGIQLYG